MADVHGGAGRTDTSRGALDLMRGDWPLMLAFGAFLTWTLLAITPLRPLGIPLGHESVYLSARVWFYVSLACCSIVFDSVLRHPDTALARVLARPATLAIAIGVQFLLGMLNWLGDVLAGSASLPTLLVMNFVLAGVVLPYLQAAWSSCWCDRLQECAHVPLGGLGYEGGRGRCVACSSWGMARDAGEVSGKLSETRPSVIPSMQLSLVVAAALYAGSVAVSYTMYSEILMSLLLLPSLLLVARRHGIERMAMRACGMSNDRRAARQPGAMAGSGGRRGTGALWRMGILFALAGAHVFNGSAEFGMFLCAPSVVLGVVAALALIVVVHAGGRALRPGGLAGIPVLCTLLILGSVSIQGIAVVQLSALDGIVASALHALVLTSEIVIYAFAWSLTLDDADIPAALTLANVGIAAGALAGIWLNARGTANVLVFTTATLVFEAVALLLFGVVWGICSASARSQAAEAGAMDDLGEGLMRMMRECHLSERECEVLRLWATGHQVGFIADRLCISKNTVKTHIAHIYKKTGTTHREALIQAIESRAIENKG